MRRWVQRVYVLLRWPGCILPQCLVPRVGGGNHRSGWLAAARTLQPRLVNRGSFFSKQLLLICCLTRVCYIGLIFNLYILLYFSRQI